MNNKVMDVLRGAFIIVLGILLAVVGVGTALDTYFAVTFIVSGVLLVALAIYSTVKKLEFGTLGFILGGILLTLATALLLGKLSFAVLIDIFIFGLMGLGFGLIAVGIAALIRRDFLYGIVEILVGGLFILFTALYLGIPEFAQAFWIIVGVLLIVLGVAIILFALIGKKPRRK